jgi:hypothetical protein
MTLHYGLAGNILLTVNFYIPRIGWGSFFFTTKKLPAVLAAGSFFKNILLVYAFLLSEK